MASEDLMKYLMEAPLKEMWNDIRADHPRSEPVSAQAMVVQRCIEDYVLQAQKLVAMVAFEQAARERDAHLEQGGQLS